MDKIIPFHFQEKEIRIIQDEDGSPWWVAKDVCSLLGFIDHNSAVRTHLDEDEKGVRQAHTLGGNQDLLTVNESGLYALIFKSSKPEARPFRKWVTSEVLPAIRKAGSYSINAQPPENIPAIAEDFQGLKKIAEIAGLQGNQAVLSANQAMVKLKGTNPLELIGATHLIAEKQERFLTPSDLGKKIGVSGRAFNKMLQKAGLQTPSRDHKNRMYWSPTDKEPQCVQMLDTGKKHGDGTPVLQIKWAESVIDLLSESQEVAI